jgi:hypothetical protein
LGAGFSHFLTPLCTVGSPFLFVKVLVLEIQ